MWWHEYEDYPHDSTLKKERTEPGKGMVGCEMHERHGWGESDHVPPKRPPSKFLNLITYLFGTKNET